MCADATQCAFGTKIAHSAHMDDHPHTSSLPAGGFVPLPRPFLDVLLCAQDVLGIGMREVLLLLLIARLTYGCRSRPWAALPPAALAAVGIGRSHAREYLRRLLDSGLIERNGGRDEYRLRSLAMPQETGLSERRRHLNALVCAHLARGMHRADAASATFSPPTHLPTIAPSREAGGRRKEKLINYVAPDPDDTGAGKRWHWRQKAAAWERDGSATGPAASTAQIQDALFTNLR
jgi:hypothetical protein